MELPDIDEENAALARTTSAQQQDDLPDIDVENARIQEEDLPDIEEENARIQEEDLPDIEEENARIQETDLPDIDVENGILAQKSQTPAPQSTPPVEQPTPPIEQPPPDTHWQEVEARGREFNLGDEIMRAARGLAKVGDYLKTSKEAKLGKELSGFGAVMANLPVAGAHMEAEQNRQMLMEEKLARGEFANTLEMTKAALTLGIPQETVKKINEAAAGNVDLARQLFSDLVMDDYERRLETRARKGNEAAELRKGFNWIQKQAAGAVNLGENVVNMTTAAPFTIGAEAANRATELHEAGADGNEAMVKGLVGTQAERMVWGAKLLKYVPFGGKVMRYVEGGAGKWLKKNAAELIGMVAKTRINELVDDVGGMKIHDGMNVETGEDQRTLGEWAKDSVSLKNNAELLLELLPVHFGMKAVSRISPAGLRAAKTRKARALMLENYGVDKERIGKLSDEDVDSICRFLADPKLTEEKFKRFVDYVARDADAGAEKLAAAVDMSVAAKEQKLTAEQEIAFDETARAFNGEDKTLNGRVKNRIQEKLAEEAVNGTPEGQDSMRTRLDDPAEMEIEINKATEEILFEDNAAEVAKSVNTKSLGTKAADRATEIATTMPRTADKTESRIAGEIGAADPDMPPDRVWEVAQYLAAHGEAASPNGQPLTKERIAEVEKAMVADKAGVVPVEQPDGTFKTVNEVEAEAAREERKNGIPETPAPNPETKVPTSETKVPTSEMTAPALQMKPVDHSGDWAPVSGKTGVFHTAEFPEVEIALQDAQPGEGTKADGTPKKIAFIENLPDPATLDEAGQLKLGKFLYEQVGKANKLGIEDVNVGRDEAEAAKYMELVDKYKNTVKTEKFQVRADSVVGLLKKSGLASDVIATEAEFNEALAASGENGQALVADGKTYGFTDGTNVYLNPAFFSTIRGLNTPIHEFGHLAIIATKSVNRAVYDRALKLVKDTGYWKEVNEHPDYASLPDWKKAEEALTRLIAERGERLEATTPKGVIAEIKQLLVDIWKSFGNALGIRDLTPEKIEKMSVEDLADAIRAEMSSGREFGTRQLSLQEGDLKAKILRFAKYQKPTSKSAKAALEAAKKAWKGLDEEQKVALGRYGDTSVLKTQEARTIANGVRMLREWDARRARISKAVKDQIKRSPNEGQKKIITGSPQYYVSQVTGDVTSPFAFAIDRGLPIPRKGDWGWDAWERLTDGMKYAEKRELMRILGGEHPKRGGMDTVLSDYAQWLGISWGEGARDFEHGRGIEDFLDDILKERAKFEKWKAGDRKTRAEDEAERDLAIAGAEQNRGGMTDAEFAEEDACVRASEARRVEAERMGEQDDLSDMPDFSRAPREDAIESNIRQMLKHDKVYDPTDSLHFAYSASQNEIAFFRDNGDLTFDIIARDKLTPNGIKRVTEVSKFYRTDENGENLDKSIQEFKSSVRSGNVGDGGKAKNGTSADANGNLALGQQNNGPKPDRQQGTGTGEAGSVNGIQLSRDGEMLFSRGGGARLVGGRTRVAADQDHGERTPGGLAAARELADVRRAPVSKLGAQRFLSLDLSSLEELRKIVSEDVRPAHVAKTEAGVARTEGQVARGEVAFWSDTIGVVDHTDKAAEKANLKAHGFFRDEDPNWCAVQSDAAIKAEKSRSDQQLSRQLEALGERRMRGLEPGGQTAERGVFADEVAKVVLAQERRVGGRLGRLQTIGKSVQDAVARMPGMNQADAEWSARRFLDWAYGQPDYSRNMSGKQLTAEMFGKWLVMPRAVEQTAPEWANAIEQTVAADPKLADAFRTLADRRLNGDEYLMRRIRKQMSRQTEEALRKINEEKDENISAGSKWRNFEEMALYGLHDTFAPVYVRMDYMTRVKIKAMKAAIKAASPADRPALKQQLDLYLGDLGQKLNRLELSRTAYERGTINEGSLYHREMVRLENEAHERWGLTTEDMSFYLDQWRVIETSGRSASFGEDVVQARKALDEMEARLGPEKWLRMQEYGNRFFAIHERELLELRDDRGNLLAEKMFGKAFIDYLRTQTHYVATERTFSVEEMDAIEVARQALRATGASNVDDVISQMFDYAGAKGAGEAIGEKDWTAPMKGSMAAKTEVRGATFKKVDRLQRALRRNQLVLDLREALTFAGVEGVHDLARTDGAKFPEGSRYGHINYLENGHKRTLVVPRHIADAFKGDPAKTKWWSKSVRMIHNTWRALIIDYNPAYRPMNLRRNIASVEKNMPGMRETYLKTVLRASFPGAGAVSDLVFDQMVKRIPATAKLFSDHTYFYFIPQMERILKIIESPSEWQQKYWEAQDANDLGKLSQMDADWDLAKEMLRANMFVSIRSAYANEKSTSFAAEAFAKKGLRTLEEIDRQLKSRDWKRKSVDRLFYLLKKTQQMTEHDDMMAKGIAYLADRKHFGLVRSSQESGDLVNRRVSIAQGERRGAAAGSLKALVPFYNMIEKGVVRHYDAYRTDFGHTLAADAKFVMGSTCSLLMAKGLAQLWMLRDCDNDEEKARKKFGKFYDYAKDYHDAYRNCSDYIRKNYSFTPLWTDGYTSVILGGTLTDEEKLLNPIVDYTVGVMAASEGLEQMPSFGSMVLDSTVRSVIPDLQMTGPLVEGMRLAFSVLSGENYEDYFRGAPAFDQKKVDMRFESLEDFKEYSAVVGGRAWNYFGGRSILSADVYGVDNGRGKAPKSLEAVLSDIPWISPVINRMVKIQVGSPERDGQAIRGRSKEIRQAIDKCAERLLKLREGDKGWHVAHPKEYKEKLAEWQQTYGLSNHDMKVLRAKYLNGLNQVRCIEKMDEHKRKLIKREAKRQGCSEEMIYIQLGDR